MLLNISASEHFTPQTLQIVCYRCRKASRYDIDNVKAYLEDQHAATSRSRKMALVTFFRRHEDDSKRGCKEWFQDFMDNILCHFQGQPIEEDHIQEFIVKIHHK